jgi:hypothetical protein
MFTFPAIIVQVLGDCRHPGVMVMLFSVNANVLAGSDNRLVSIEVSSTAEF